MRAPRGKVWVGSLSKPWAQIFLAFCLERISNEGVVNVRLAVPAAADH